jgi:hypothetical protein
VRALKVPRKAKRPVCDLSTTEGYRQGFEAGLRRAQELAKAYVPSPAIDWECFDQAIDAEVAKGRS